LIEIEKSLRKRIAGGKVPSTGVFIRLTLLQKNKSP